MDIVQKVLMRWQAGTLSGWGLLGLNLFEHWASDPVLQPLMGVPLELRDFPGTSPLRYTVMRPAMDYSNQFMTGVASGEIHLRDSRAVVIDPFGNEFTPAIQHSGQAGLRNIARCIFEDSHLGGVDVIAAYDSVLCASDWAAKLLRASTTKPVAMIHEGIDHSLFYPGPRSGILDPDCFYIFTGGKVEFRKAQDLVIAAFREFASRHDDAVLVAAWHSPWAGRAGEMQGKLQERLHQDAAGVPQVRRWVTENGIKSHQFIELPLTANSLMPSVLREMDCALQVSRCEACTNLPAMEAMACGIPVILANNSGMKDLIEAGNCIALSVQRPVRSSGAIGTDGWGESDVGEIVDALEVLYSDSEKRRHIGIRGAEWILEQKRTWRDYAATLKSHVLSLL